MRWLLLALAGSALLLLASCTPNEQFRTDTATACLAPSPPDKNQEPPEACERKSMEVYPITGAGHLDDEFILSYVEFTDQGKAHDRAQIDTLFARLREEAKRRDLCLIVFVHGWKHNADNKDFNVRDFRLLLREMADTEWLRPSVTKATSSQKPPAAMPRKVVGIYVGWRGMSSNVTEVGGDLTFWTRKDVAHRVAEGSVREVLARTKAFRDLINQTTWSGRTLRPGDTAPPEDRRRTRMLTIGHSFGGLIVYSALSEYLTEQAVTSTVKSEFHDAGLRPAAADDADKMIPSYGDLVIIINPAIEAMRYEPVRELIEGRATQRYARWQNPVFVEVTSVDANPFKGDWATGLVFPLGRFFNTIFQSFVDDEYRQSMTALGHYKPFWTHTLTNVKRDVKPDRRAPPDPVAECKDFQSFNATYRPDGYLRPGWQRQYVDGARLQQMGDSPYDPNNPYWVVRADPSVILDHTDIEEPVFVGFVRQLYDDLVRLKDGGDCARLPGMAPTPTLGAEP